MFVGQHYHTLDAKKRLVIPAKLRHSSLLTPNEADTKGVYVTLDTKSYQNNNINLLVLYPASVWAKNLELLEQNALRSEEAAWYLRKVSADTEFCKIDEQWRVLIPLRLINTAELKRDIVIVGAGSKIEVWDTAKWDNVYKWLQSQSTTFEKYVYKIST
ncbi:MAG: hypothetical protein WC980_00930 [Candidatus Brocadiia bacterium]